MKCCHCSHDAIKVIDGAPICLSCHAHFQHNLNSNISSAYQAHIGTTINESMFKSRNDLMHKHISEKNTEVNNYYNIINGNNNRAQNTGNISIKNIRIDLPKLVIEILKIVHDKVIFIFKFLRKIFSVLVNISRK